MQSTTHFLVGIWIYKVFILLAPNFPTWSLINLTILLALFSHLILDCFAKITYHVPNAQWKDLFWLSYHIIFVYVGSLLLLIFYLPQYWWVMLAATLPDIIDWYIMRPIFKKGPYIHPYIDKVRNNWFSWLPDLTSKKWTVVLEIGFDVILLLLLILFP
ncbi:hypothetical protein [Candidatus Harpocratesius sp.]